MYQRVSRERVTVMTGRSGPVCGAEAMLCALWSCGKAVGGVSQVSYTRYSAVSPLPQIRMPMRRPVMRSSQYP